MNIKLEALPNYNDFKCVDCLRQPPVFTIISFSGRVICYGICDVCLTEFLVNSIIKKILVLRTCHYCKKNTDATTFRGDFYCSKCLLELSESIMDYLEKKHA